MGKYSVFDFFFDTFIVIPALSDCSECRETWKMKEKWERHATQVDPTPFFKFYYGVFQMHDSNYIPILQMFPVQGTYSISCQMLKVRWWMREKLAHVLQYICILL